MNPALQLAVQQAPVRGRCEAIVYPAGMNFPRPRQCRNHAVTLSGDGKKLCGAHSPQGAASREKAKRTRWESRQRAERARFEAAVRKAKGA